MKNRSTKTRSMIMGMAVALWAMLSLANDLSAKQITVSTSRSNSNSTSISQKNGTYRFSSKQGNNGIEIEYEGDIAFTDDDKAIKSISRDGYIKIRKTSFGERRELLAEGNSAGTIDYQFYEGRRRADFDAAAQKWLADVLPEAIRATGIGAESRTQRIYAKGGLDAVLKETSQIKSDHVSQMYLKAVLGKQNLNNKELVKIAAYVPANLSSDHYITEVFKDYSTLFLKNNETTEAFLTAIGRMDSDHYVSLILMRALKEDLSDAMISKVLDAAERMDSDHYKTEVIKKVMDRKDLSSSAVNRIVKATSDIDSDHYATLILREALDRPNLTDEAFESLMEAISNIDSDHYVTETMRGLLRQSNPSDRVVEAVIKRVGRMDSDHYRTLVINDLMENQQISKKYFNDLLVTVNDVGSDNYAAQILKSVLREQDLSDENYDKVLSRVANIDSDFYKVGILKDVLNARDLNKTHMISILKTISSIGSDYYKSEVLKSACSSVSGADAEVKDLFRSVAKTIKSDTYYGKVARCID